MYKEPVLNIDDLIRLQKEMTEEFQLKPRRKFAEAIGADPSQVNERTVFFIHGYPHQRGELPDFVRLSPLIEKGQILMMDEPKLDFGFNPITG